MNLCSCDLVVLLSGHEVRCLTLSWVFSSETEWLGVFISSCKNRGVGRWSVFENQQDHEWMYLMVLYKLFDPSRMHGFSYQWHGDKDPCPSHRSVRCFFRNNIHKKLFSLFSLKSCTNVKWCCSFTFSSICILFWLFSSRIQLQRHALRSRRMVG